MEIKVIEHAKARTTYDVTSSHYFCHVSVSRITKKVRQIHFNNSNAKFTSWDVCCSPGDQPYVHYLQARCVCTVTISNTTGKMYIYYLFKPRPH